MVSYWFKLIVVTFIMHGMSGANIMILLSSHDWKSEVSSRGHAGIHDPKNNKSGKYNSTSRKHSNIYYIPHIEITQIDCQAW